MHTVIAQMTYNTYIYIYILASMYACTMDVYVCVYMQSHSE